MTRYLTILATALAVACSGEKDPGDTGDGGEPDCGNSVAGFFPLADSTDAYYKTQVRLTLEVEDQGAVITVSDAGGAEVPGSTAVDAEVVSWTGDADLEPLTTYSVALTYECGEATYTFTTSDVGTPVGDTNLVNEVYALDLAQGDWLKPPGVGPLLAGFLGDTQVFVSPTVITANEITVLGGIGNTADGQDLCSPTIDFPPAVWSDPYFELTSPSLTLSVSDIEVNIENLALSGAFAPDGGRIQGASLGGSIDTRALVSLVDEEGQDPNAVCLVVESLGVFCEECTDGTGPYCLTVYVDSIGAANIDKTLVPRTDEDILNDLECTPAPA